MHEFGCKVSIATPATSPKGGQFVLHAKALHGNPFDGHTLGPVIADMEKLGISYDDVMRVLEEEGVAKFEASWNELLETIKTNMGL